MNSLARMRLPRPPAAATLAVTLAVTLAAILAVAPAPAAAGTAPASPGPPVRTIVALGDSYAAGIGAGTDVIVGGCRRSSGSYPVLLAQRLGVSLLDRSCPGATIAEAAARSYGLPRDDAAILIQAGGNDMGFVEVATACFIASAATCARVVATAGSRLPAMRARLATLATDLRRRSPGSTIVVLGYPRLLGSPARCAALIDGNRVRRINALQRSLDRNLRAAASDAGVDYLDWPRSVDRHSLCSPTPWFAWIDTAARLDDLLHPTLPATQRMAAHLAAYLEATP